MPKPSAGRTYAENIAKRRAAKRAKRDANKKKRLAEAAGAATVIAPPIINPTVS